MPRLRSRQQQAIVAEVNRSLVALKRQHPELSLSRTWLWGDPTSLHGLAGVLRKRFACDVNVEDPLVLPGLTFDGDGSVTSHALFTGPVGLLFGQTGRALSRSIFCTRVSRPYRASAAVVLDRRQRCGRAVDCRSFRLGAGPRLVRWSPRRRSTMPKPRISRKKSMTLRR